MKISMLCGVKSQLWEEPEAMVLYRALTLVMSRTPYLPLQTATVKVKLASFHLGLFTTSPFLLYTIGHLPLCHDSSLPLFKR